MLSSHAEDVHQMYFGGSVVGKSFNNWYSDLAHLSPNFHREGQKVLNLASFKTSLNFEPLTFENAAIYLNSETKVQCCDDHPISWPSLVKLGPCTLCVSSVSSDPTPKIARENAVNRRSLSRRLFNCAHILYRV